MDESDHLFLTVDKGAFYPKKDLNGRDVLATLSLGKGASGAVFSRSNCCGALMYWSKDGKKTELCSQCGKPNPPTPLLGR